MLRHALASAPTDSALINLCCAPQTSGQPSLPELVLRAEKALEAGQVDSAHRLIQDCLASCVTTGSLPDQSICRANYVLGQIRSRQSCESKGQDLVKGTLRALEPVIKGIEAAAQNSRYGLLVYNGSVHYWHISRVLQREGLRCHLLPSEQTVVDAVRKLPDKQSWLSCLLLQLALGQLEVGKADDAVKSVEEAQQLSKGSASPYLSSTAVAQAHLLQVTGKAAKAAKPKAPAKPAAAAGKSKGKDSAAGTDVEAAAALEEEAGLLAAVQAVHSAAAVDATGAEERLKDILQQCEVPQADARGTKPKVVARVGWVAAMLGVTPLAEACASRAAGSQAMGPRTWADLIRAQQQIALYSSLRSTGEAASKPQLLDTMDKLDAVLHAFVGCQDVDGVHSACRLVWNAALPLLHHKPSKQVKRTMTSAAQALASVASPLHGLRALLHLEIAKGDMADDLFTKAASEIKKAQALDYLATQQAQQQWDLERPLDRFIVPLNQALSIKAAVEEVQTDSERAVLLIERARDSKGPASRAQHLSQALQRLAALPAIQPPKPTDARSAERQAQHAAARLRTRHYCDIATLAWEAQLEGLVRQACPSGLALDWSAEVDPEVVRWQAEVSLLEAQAAVLACRKLQAPMLEPPSEQSAAVVDPVTGVRKADGSLPQLQQLIPQALLTAMKLGTSARETWMVANSAIAIWNTYLPNLQQQRYAPLLDVLLAATGVLLTQPSVELLAPQLTGLVTAGALAAEHAALLAVLASAHTGNSDAGSAGTDSVSAEQQPNARSLQGARKLAAPVLTAAATAAAATAAPAARPSKGAGKTDTASGLLSAQAMAQLKAAAEACEAVMNKLSSASNAAGGQQLLEAFARVQQLRGMPTSAPASISPTLQQTGKVIALIESLSALTPAALDPAKQEADAQQALSLLTAQQPLNLELHAKLAKAALQAGATTAALQAATALIGAALPRGRAAQDVVEASDAPGVAAGDWQWLAVASCVLGQAIRASTQDAISAQPPATQIQVTKICMAHLLAAARFACFAQQAELLQTAAMAFWNGTVQLMGAPEARVVLLDGLDELASLMGGLKCPNDTFQVELVCLLCQCMADAARWEDGLKACEAAMGVLPAAAHLPLSHWKVVFLSMLGRSIEGEMARIAERGSQHAASAWLRIANHAEQPEQQLQAHQQAVKAVQSGDASLCARYMTALGEWLVQQGTAKEAGKEVLLGAVALLEPPRPPTPKVEELSRLTTLPSATAGEAIAEAASHEATQTDDGPAEITTALELPHMEAAKLDLLMRTYTLLAIASNTRQEQLGYAVKAQACGVSLLSNGIASREDTSNTAGVVAASPQPDWLAFEVTQPMIDQLCSSTDAMLPNKAAITVPEVTLRCIDRLVTVLESQYLHTLAIPMCHLKHLLARAVLHSPALAAASQLQLAALAEALALPEAAAEAERKAGPLQLSAAQLEQFSKAVAMREYMTGGQEELGMPSSPRKGRRKGRSHGGRPESRAAPSSRGSNHPTNRALSSRGSTVTGSSPTGACSSLASGKVLQPYCEAEAWLQQGEYLAFRGTYGPAKELLLPALRRFQAFGNTSAAARCLLSLAQLECLANQPEAAFHLLQQLQQTGPDVATTSRAVQCYAELCVHPSCGSRWLDAALAVQSGIDLMEKLAVEQGALGLEGRHAAAQLWMLLGRLHLKKQPAAADTPAVPVQPGQAVHCFQQAALKCAAFGASQLHVEAAMAEAGVLLSDQLGSATDRMAAAQQARELLQAAETEAHQMHQEAVSCSPAPGEPAAPQTTLTPQTVPSAQTPAPTPTSQASLPSARLLFRAQVARAEALVACAAALQNQQEGSASYALPGRDTAVVKHFLAAAGMLEPGSVPGYFEEEAIKCASSALQLCSLPAEQCQAHLALGRAQLSLHHLRAGGQQAAMQLAWFAESAADPTGDSSKDVDMTKEVQKAAVSSLQACINTAVQAGNTSTAVAAAELVAACLGKSDAQASAEAILMAQGGVAAGDLEALYRDAAGPQAQEQLLLLLQDHLEAHPALGASCQRLQHRLQEQTCFRSRLDLTPQVLDILKAIPPTTWIIALHVTQDGAALYCAALKGQQPSRTVSAGKSKPAKHAAEVKADPVEPPALARVPLPSGGLAAVAAQLKQYITAKESRLAVAGKAATAAPTDHQLAQQWQDAVDSLAAVLGAAAPLLAPPPAAQDAKGAQQPTAVLLLLDPQLSDLPFEWLPQLKAASAVVRDFSLHVHHTRMSVAASSPQGIALKQLSYIVDPCMEHNPPPPPAARATTLPAAKPGPKSTSKPVSTPADKPSRSLVQAFQQDILPAFGKEWVGITGNPNFLPTEAQYAQLLRQAAGVVYCGVGRFLQCVSPAVVAGADMRACELAVVLERGQGAKCGSCRVLPKGQSGWACLGDGAAVAKLLTLQGVQSVAVNMLPSPATESVDCCLHLLQSLGQGKTVGEGIQSVRGTYNSGTVVYGLISHKAAVK